MVVTDTAIYRTTFGTILPAAPNRKPHAPQSLSLGSLAFCSCAHRLTAADGGVAVAKATEEFGTVNFVSSVTQNGASKKCHANRTAKIFQLYVQGDLKLGQSVLTRLDGGSVGGSDVLEGVALGARPVVIGKLQDWDLGAAGQHGLLRVLEILESEIVTTMTLLGITPDRSTICGVFEQSRTVGSEL
jgi:isopentenyl diphosphate isomerase/L-lactate dehydrogenase-like FMN-dependent dehydrogenase